MLLRLLLAGVQSEHFFLVPDSSVGKESACNSGDPGLIPGSGRSAREGIGYPLQYSWASLVAQLLKESACNVGDLGSIPGLEKSPGEGNSYPLQYSGLENPRDRGAWLAAVYGVTKSWTQLKRLSGSSIHSVSLLCSSSSGYLLTTVNTQGTPPVYQAPCVLYTMKFAYNDSFHSHSSPIM